MILSSVFNYFTKSSEFNDNLTDHTDQQNGVNLEEFIRVKTKSLYDIAFVI